jgi:hypothetical protein
VLSCICGTACVTSSFTVPASSHILVYLQHFQSLHQVSFWSGDAILNISPVHHLASWVSTQQASQIETASVFVSVVGSLSSRPTSRSGRDDIGRLREQGYLCSVYCKMSRPLADECEFQMNITKYLHRWDIFIMLIVLYTFFTVPVNLAFNDRYVS